jgi:hypothetical protein
MALQETCCFESSEEANSLLAAIVECCDAAMIAEDLEGIILYWNTAAEQLLGFRAEEAVGIHSHSGRAGIGPHGSRASQPTQPGGADWTFRHRAPAQRWHEGSRVREGFADQGSKRSADWRVADDARQANAFLVKPSSTETLADMCDSRDDLATALLRARTPALRRFTQRPGPRGGVLQ